ncbi:bifunctional 3-(3-hydroxy-phenyl)propionate/3-hydroxycinnamic acid hydroxylase [soil metagenome]
MATDNAAAVDYDVVVVGFGPSGAVAAGLLGSMGLRTFVCDRMTEVYPKPRALSVDHEILRVFQQMGISKQIEPFVAPFTPSEFYGVDGQLIKRVGAVAEPYPLGYIPSMVFTQPPVEEALRRHVSGLSNVDVELGTEVVGLEQDEQSVRLQLRSGDGATRSVSSRYVVACDGASSTVRGLLGLGLDDLQFDEPWLVVDVLANERGIAKLPDVSIQFCEPDRPCTYLVGRDNHRRWEISLHEDEDPQLMATPAETWRLLSRWITPEDGELWRQASYRFHALVAHDWRKGRVFIAGDAAHQQPPFLGQGMCQGIRDVANLTWKLKAAIDGVANDALLDTYGEERGAHVRQLTSRIKGLGAVICERDVGKARARDAKLIAEAGGVIKTVARQDIIPPLETGLLSDVAHAANGLLFPQPWVESESGRVHMDEIAGHGWRLVVDADTAPSFELPADAVKRLGLRTVRISTTAARSSGDLQEADGVLAQWFARHAVCFAIVRPDNYVYAVATDAKTLSDRLEGLVERLS